MGRRRVELEGEGMSLPRELIYLYLIGPIVASPVLVGGLFEKSWSEAVKAILIGYVPFLSIPAVIHPFYRHVMPHLMRGVEMIPLRFVIHAVVSALLAALVSRVIHPLHSYLEGAPAPMLKWISVSVVITWAFMLPGLVVRELRARAYAVERLALEQQRAALRAQIEAIQSRTNPHFLFNALNTVASLIPEDARLAESTLERLADLLRYALQSSKRERVPLGDELRMLEDYLAVQKARFGERLTFAIDVEPGLEQLQLPPLLLQPLIENAVLHGVAERAEGGAVHLRVRRNHASVEVCVEDDGPGPGSSTHKGSGTSLDDLRTRLNLLYGPLGDLFTEKNERGGFTARLVLPAAGGSGP